MDKFEVGDTAIYVRPGSPFYGKEVTILSDLHFENELRDHITGNIKSGFRYDITSLDGIAEWVAQPEWLYKPKDEGARDWFNKNIRIKDEVSTV